MLKKSDSSLLLRPPRFDEKVLRRFRFRDCFSHLRNAPTLDLAQRDLLEELRTEGTLILPGYVDPAKVSRMRTDTQEALESLDFELPCLAQSRLDPVRHKGLIDNFLFATPGELGALGVTFSRSEVKDLGQALTDFQPAWLTAYMLERSETFREVWLDERILSLVSGYMGLVPKLAEAYVRRNFPTRYWTMNHYWHRDLNDRFQLLKMFVFLTDCSLETGPHEYIRRSHSDFSALNGKRYFQDEEVDLLHPVGSESRLVSEVKAGTVILEDTRGVHRARMPISGYRDLGYAVFVPLQDSTSTSLYRFPERAFESLSEFQRSFIPRCNIC